MKRAISRIRWLSKVWHSHDSNLISIESSDVIGGGANYWIRRNGMSDIEIMIEVSNCKLLILSEGSQDVWRLKQLKLKCSVWGVNNWFDIWWVTYSQAKDGSTIILNLKLGIRI